MSQPPNTSKPTEHKGAAFQLNSCIQFLLVFCGHIGYLVTLVGVVLASVFILLPLTPFPRLRRRVAGTMLRGYLKFFALYYIPASRACRIVEISGGDRIPRPGAAVFVANHRSAIDAILLLPLLPPTSLIIKARHARKLGYACLVHFFDFVTMEAGSLSVLRRSMDKCRRLMAEGMSLLVFPEGMRTSSTTLMPFADLPFRIAIEQGVPIIPVVIHSDRPFLNRRKGSYFPPETVRFRIQFLEPISTENERDPIRLSDVASHRMAAALADLDRMYPQ